MKKEQSISVLRHIISSHKDDLSEEEVKVILEVINELQKPKNSFTTKNATSRLLKLIKGWLVVEKGKDVLHQLIEFIEDT